MSKTVHYQFSVDKDFWDRFKRAVYVEAGIRGEKQSIRMKLLELMEEFVQKVEAQSPLFPEEKKKTKK